jgi:hypothetical protein
MRQKFDAKGSEFLSFAALAPLREETSFVLFATFVVTPRITVRGSFDSVAHSRTVLQIRIGSRLLARVFPRGVIERFDVRRVVTPGGNTLAQRSLEAAFAV